jgi:replicative superfamily II helicase
LFHFDSTYRPVPLVINFIGVKNPKDPNNNMARKRNIRDIYNEKAYEIAIGHLKNDKQVLIFVHSRRETVKYCEYIVERSKTMKDEHVLRSAGIGKQNNNLRDNNLKKLIINSVGFHHAGMVRSDRDAVERMFERG